MKLVKATVVTLFFFPFMEKGTMPIAIVCVRIRW
jgi:hypothetical protein